jgi:purine-binding chemotaxis protein CheW
MELVIFDIGNSRLALRASCVSKVLDPLPVTPLPYAPPQVQGLVNVSGAVLLKVDLALRLGLQRAEVDSQGNLLVVMTGHESVVVQVDRVFNKVTQDDESIKFYQEGERSDLIRGEFLLDGEMILLLSEAGLGLQDMEPAGVPEGGGGLIGMVPDLGEERAAEIQLNDLPTLAVGDGEETYALHMDHVQEIIELGPLTALPGAGPEVLGLMQLRGQALMVLSLARLLGRPMTEQPRFVLVISIDDTRVGLSVAEILGIERYAKDDVQPVSGGDSQLEGYLPGSAAREGHMTGLLAVHGLVSSDGMAIYRRYLIQQASQMAVTVDKTARTTRRMLSFRLGPERCALDLSAVDRVEEYAAAVDLPEGDNQLAGVIQIKGEIAPVTDLRSMLGLTPVETSSYVVVRIDGAPWALIVDRIERVIEIPEKDIAPVRTQTSDYLSEVARLDGELISLLSLEPLRAAAADLAR